MIEPYSLKDAPALIERLLPVQKLSAEAYKEQMSHIGKTLASLGSYWKGRKPLVLNKACILGSLLPATASPARDLEIFEKLMAMDDESFVSRLPTKLRPIDIIQRVPTAAPHDFFTFTGGPAEFPPSAAALASPEWAAVKISWRADVAPQRRLQIEAAALPRVSYRVRVDEARRPEEVGEIVHAHIWQDVNRHLGTEAHSFPQLVEQLGIMRYGHRPKLADTFAGSGQIPFEGARLGCDVQAADLNPIACMLSWGAFNIVGGSEKRHEHLRAEQDAFVERWLAAVDALGVESDGNGWRGKVYLYCAEVVCPQTGWKVPLLPTRVVSIGYRVVAELVPDDENKRYQIRIKSAVSDQELASAESGTLRSDGRGQDAYLIHEVGGVEYRTKISTIRGDYRMPEGTAASRLRMWETGDFKPRANDIYQERLYCIEWTRQKLGGKSDEYEFRAVTDGDLERERVVEEYVAKHIPEWQREGFLPDMRIEPGFNTDQPIRERGWTFWHHLFNPRQLLLGALARKLSNNDARLQYGILQMLNVNSRLSRWNNSRGGGGIVKGVFDNQALNTLFNYGCRGATYAAGFLQQDYKSFPLPQNVSQAVSATPAAYFSGTADLFVTDPPYGDAVRYEEILEFFIAWLRKNPPAEFADWVWDSRRSFAIKGEDEAFRKEMVAAYRQMTDRMPDNGIQVIMFTHQSGSIWADMANIVWASGLQVTAAWYVVTETESALRAGSYVKGTVLLVLRKRRHGQRATRDDLAWEIQEEVEEQVKSLAGLNQSAKGRYRDENVFEDADIQMAGYAAALRALTKYGVIDGRDMTAEAIRPRVKGEITFVDELIAFAVDTANQCLVPQGLAKSQWDRLSGVERFYLKMLDMEARGAKTLDNYQNFAKAFKVRDFKPLMSSQKANDARLRSAAEFGRSEMSEGSQLHESVLRAVLYGIMELMNDMDSGEVLTHLTLNVADYYSDSTQRILAIELADYFAKRLEHIRPDEASAARVLRDLVKNQRLG